MENNNRVVFVYFSKDRPLQLELALRTNKKNCKEFDIFQGFVIYKTTNNRMKYAYENLIKECAKKYPNITFYEEKDFKNDLLIVLDDYEYVYFIVDDTVFLRKYSIKDILSTLDTFRGMLGFSLRLGENTTYCYPLNVENDIPYLQKISHGMLSFDWTTAGVGDFSYPLELSSSIYRVKDIAYILKNSSYNNPNDLEWVLERNKKSLNNFRYLGSYETSIGVSLPINKVQIVNNNRSGNKAEYTSGSLLEKFEEGYVIDDKPFREFVSNGCHQEVDLKFIEKDAM